MHIIGADLAHIQRDATGKQMTRFTNDVQFMRDATVKAFTGIARDLITVIVLAWVMILLIGKWRLSPFWSCRSVFFP